jgi:N-acetylmuramoyl-L-alanine amidase
MIVIRPKIYAIIIFIALFIAAPLMAAPSQGHLTAKRYNLARSRYNQIKFSSKTAARLSNWQAAAQAFVRAYKTNPYSGRAPACLLTLGHIYFKMYKRFANKDYLHKSLTYYDDVASLFPKHPYADDALYHTARIYALAEGDYKDAALTLARLLVVYPNGDMLKKAARDLLRWKAAQAKKEKIRTARRKAAAHNAKMTLPSAAAHPQGLKAAVIKELRHWSTKDYTRVVIETSKPVIYKGFLLKTQNGRPRRLYINLKNCRVSRRMQKTIPFHNGLLRRLRSAQYKPNIGRVVLDMTSISDYKIFNLEKPFRIVIDIKGVKRRAKTQTLLPAPLIPRNPTLAQQLGLGIKRIIIDPGHGGKDPGAIGVGGLREKDIVLKVAKMLARKLRSRLTAKVILTRTRDVFIPLEERTAIANTREGDLFISIHANAARSPKACGIETYYLDLTKNKANMRLAASENATSAHNISDLQKILSSLMHNSKKQESAKLARIVNRNLVEEMDKDYGSIKNHGVKKAPFIVLIGAQMPSILTEVAFITNHLTAKRMHQHKYLEDLADGLANGIIQYTKSLNLARR